MNCLRSLSGIAALLLSAAASAQTIPDNPAPAVSALPPVLQNVGFEPRLNAQLPLDLAFHDEVGGNVQLRDYFRQKPVVLALVYYGCPMLCNQVEQGVAGTLRMPSFNRGRDYQAVFGSFVPRETPVMTLHKKEARIH